MFNFMDFMYIFEISYLEFIKNSNFKKTHPIICMYLPLLKFSRGIFLDFFRETCLYTELLKFREKIAN